VKSANTAVTSSLKRPLMRISYAVCVTVARA
jgi:hypothetical protein